MLILSFLLFTRKDIDVTIIRTAGMLYQERGADSITNLYTVKLINKTTREEKVYIRLENQPGRIQMIGKNEITIPVEGQSAASFFVVLPIIKNRKDNNNHMGGKGGGIDFWTTLLLANALGGGGRGSSGGGSFGDFSSGGGSFGGFGGGSFGGGGAGGSW
jgi:hypothetical protein